jgi:hydroxyacylglutathione hydrolase
MPLIFEQIHTPGIAQLSYLIGDDSNGCAAVIDPRPDVDIYLQLARDLGVGITHIFETHIHADFMSGTLELKHRIPSAQIFASNEGHASYGFEHEPVKDGQRFDLGAVVLTACFTPGHTPEHISYLAAETDRENAPWAIFTGDSLLVDSVGRPDLLGHEQTEALAEQLFQTINGFFRKLDGDIIVYPGHGAGSSCGPDIGERKSSTIAYEKKNNPYLQIDDERTFIRQVLETAPPEPRHYKPIKQINARGPVTFGGMPPVPTLPAARFRAAAEDKCNFILDTRSILAFGGGHVPGALHISARPELSPWAGWMLPFEAPLLLVLDRDNLLPDIVALLWRVGFTRFAGYLVGGMKAWDNHGYPLAKVPQLTVHELHENGDGAQILDVRTPAEWEDGHIPRARHIFVPELAKNLEQLDRTKPVITYCDSGFRASIAASFLQRAGFSEVRNVPGSWQAWTAEHLPVEK